MALISIIIPVYKAEKYIERCIKSILAQTFKDFELLLVDDGSPDRCGQICDEFALQDERIKVIHKENGGLSDARNAGLNIMTGTYVAFVDSDDYIHPEMINTLYEKMVINNADIAICGFVRVDEDGAQLEIPKRIVLEDGVLNKTEVLGKINDDLEFGIVCNKLYDAQLFSNIRFPLGKIHEDSFVLPKVYIKSHRITAIPEALYYYVKNPNSITNSVLSVKNYDLVESYYEKIRLFEKEDLQTLLPEATEKMFDQYMRYSKWIDIGSEEDRIRQRDIKCMVRYCYLKYGRNIRKAEIIGFEMPALFKILQRAKNILQIMRM